MSQGTKLAASEAKVLERVVRETGLAPDGAIAVSFPVFSNPRRRQDRRPMPNVERALLVWTRGVVGLLRYGVGALLPYASKK